MDKAMMVFFIGLGIVLGIMEAFDPAIAEKLGGIPLLMIGLGIAGLIATAAAKHRGEPV